MVDELTKYLGILSAGEVDIFDLGPVQQLLRRYFESFAVGRVGDARTVEDLGGDVSRGEFRGDTLLDLGDDLGAQRGSIGGCDEQDTLDVKPVSNGVQRGRGRTHTRSSPSGSRCPIAIQSSTSACMSSTIAYSSELPKRTPPGLRTPSDRPKIVHPPVRELNSIHCEASSARFVDEVETATHISLVPDGLGSGVLLEIRSFVASVSSDSPERQRHVWERVCDDLHRHPVNEGSGGGRRHAPCSPVRP
jgi:hypothetical protein